MIDFRNNAQTSLTTWTKVKLSYLVVSYSRLAPAAAVNEGITTNRPAMIWATSQYVDTTTAGINGAAIFTDAVFATSGITTQDAGGGGCGLHTVAGSNPSRMRFGIRCDASAAATAAAAAVDYDVAVHTYIMGFRFASTTSDLIVDADYTGFVGASAPANKYEVAFYDDATTFPDRTNINTAWAAAPAAGSVSPYAIKFTYAVAAGGPQYTIDNQGGKLVGIKLAVVLSVINPLTRGDPFVPDNGFGSTSLGYSYSGLYQEIDPLDFNVKTIIDNNKFDKFNNLHTRLPAVKYAIYGFSSFNLAAGSGCTSFSLDLTLDGVNALTVSTNQKSSLTGVTIQSDQYFPQTQGVCTPGLEFSKLAI